jgi:hypothetical protein
MSMIASNQPHHLPIAYDPEDPFHRFPSDYALNHADADLLTAEETKAMVLQEANHMSQMFTITVSSSSTEEGLSVLDRLSSLVQTLLLLTPKAGADLKTTYVLDSCRYAAALHIFFPLCGYYPDPTLMVHQLVHSLKGSLSYQTLEQSDLLLWLFFVGGVSACDMPERDWFVGHLVVMTEDLEIGTWELIRARLTSVVWYAVFCEQSFRKLWGEVEKRSRELGEMSVAG